MKKTIRYAFKNNIPIAEVTLRDDDGNTLSVSNRLSQSPVFSEATTKVIGINEYGEEEREIIDFGGALISGSLDPEDAPLLDSVELLKDEKAFIKASKAYWATQEDF